MRTLVKKFLDHEISRRGFTKGVAALGEELAWHPEISIAKMRNKKI